MRLLQVNRRSLALDMLMACLIVGIGASPGVAETWAERLGYPADSKVLILHANELGLCYETNASGAKLLEEGPVKSGGTMVPAPWFGDWAEWCRAHPDADVGLELTLNSELKNYRWQPSATGLVPTLVDSNGFLWRAPIQTMVNATAGDVEIELREQIARAKMAGLSPSHLTTHLGTLVTRPDFMEVYLRIARQEWIPAMIVELTPEQVERFREQGFPLPDSVIEMLADYPLPKVDDLQFVGEASSYEAKKNDFLKMVSELKPGITQIAFHPAIDSPALPRITRDAQQRVWDSQLFEDAEVRAALAAEGIVITDWREIMQRFEGRPEIDSE
jgi:predicted glycoside hydrolase/deacetylase ChbG (UPF0249 family)